MASVGSQQVGVVTVPPRWLLPPNAAVAAGAAEN
jgi:hypothetical protein